MTTDSPSDSDAWSQLLEAIGLSWPTHQWRDLGVVVGCSGGADSVGLLVALAHLHRDAQPASRGFLVAAHYNHGLRAAESDHDESFVGDLASRLGVAFVSDRSEQNAHDEASLRSQRLQFFEQTANRSGARYIAVAHSADDNAETVLHHLLRGTGPAGLAGINRTRSIGQDLVMIRPLLDVRRSSIRRALESIQQSWREDSSNTNVDYRRNWIRHELIPLIESEFPQATQAIGRAIEGQSDWRRLIERWARNWLDGHVVSREVVEITPDSQADSVVLVAAAQLLWDQQGWPRGEMTREHWMRLAGALQSGETQRFSLPGKVDVRAGTTVQIRRP
ncbi:MAG: tRNA lysidine(34) synthetase TilS [Rubripirellula sp.]